MPPVCPRLVCLAGFLASFACSPQRPDAPGETQVLEPAATPVAPAPTQAGTSPLNNGTTPAPATTPTLAPVCAVGAADVNVVIRATVGPLGGAPAPITNKLYSMNIDDKVPVDYVPTPNPNFVAYLKALKPALLRWPPGYYSQTYQFTQTGTGKSAMTPALIDAFMRLCTEVGAKPYIGINTLTGTPQNAAEFVQFVNGTRKYGVTWWHIGNEPDVDTEDRTKTPATYATTFNAYRSAMIAADPTIKLVGGEVFTGAHVLGFSGFTDWITPILQGTAQAPMDAIAWHYYPLDSSQVLASSSATATIAHLLQESSPDWPPAGLDFAKMIFPPLRATRTRLAPKAEIWVDEFAEDSGKANGGGTGNVVAGALWAADAVGRFAENGADALFKFMFKADANHFYTLLDANYQPRPEYYAYWLYAQHFGDRVVQVQNDSQSVVAAHASVQSADGSLRLMLVNKSTTAQRTRINLADYTPTSARRYQLLGRSLTDTAMTLNGQSLTMANIGMGADAIPSVATTDACRDNVVVVPPLSVTLLILSNR